MMTLKEAWRKLDTIPADCSNINTVQDAASRLNRALHTAMSFAILDDLVPGYVEKAVSDLNSWIQHAQINK